VEGYIRKFDIPLHPLFSQGYTSIGCAPCTQPCSNPSEERAGRWVGLAKKECGLHTSWKDKGKTEGTVEFVGKVTSANEEQPALGKKQASA
jgi:3'-phosphoadenosine 5'-phosphosulfate sulfotransferase (PAPS reductase)/FAD synthetase